MIRKINMKNFIRIEEADIEIGDVTLLYGPNSGGKSSIMRAIELVLCMLLGPVQGREYPNLSDYASIGKEELRIEAQVNDPFGTFLLTAKFSHPIERQKPKVTSYEFESKRYEFLHRYDEKQGGSEVIYRKKVSRMKSAPPPQTREYLLDTGYLSSLQGEGVELGELLDLSGKLKDLKKYLEEQGRQYLPYLYLYRSSRDDLLNQARDGIRDLYSIERAKIGELIEDLNIAVGDSMSIEDLILGREEIFVRQEGFPDLPLSSMSDGFLQILNILLGIYRIDNFIELAEKLSMRLGGILLVEVFDAGVHVDWLVNLINLIIDKKIRVKLVAELHTGLLLSSAIAHGFPAYYVHNGRAWKLTKENITDLELFRREIGAYREVVG
ncbi:AAA family ATPase [Candidatus Methanodesulfokora washburnensis]|uniref:ATP-binding protein n=1 Tax=Candidatus Methanodesulfokora washburnensis TaxID=2478471 RepID=A0A3R9RMN6_9CREN|nr:AAA family ATPase [Candidatus Methanodesulfokores washburnensis]RSN73935.1 ATP-binding protein [Candidatus Methanodesulfokores washburnensis]